MARGTVRFARYYAQCRGGSSVSASLLPDLRSSTYLQSAALFRVPPLEGAFTQRGIPDFSGFLQKDSIEAIRSDLTDMGRATLPAAAAAAEVP